jgi:hypothetical protein
MSPRRAICIALISIIFILSLSCRPAVDWDKGEFYALTPAGDFVKTDSPASVKEVAMQPWPRQVRVTDLYADGDRLFLAVNRHGLTESNFKNDSVSFRSRFDAAHFGGRTVTRIFPYQNELFCHVYFDSAFSEEGVEAEPAERIGLLRYSPAVPEAGFRPVSLGYPPPGEPWEAVVARPLDSARLAFEWKKTSPDCAEFKYSLLDLESGIETEETRSWFYDAPKPLRPSPQDRDPVLHALVLDIEDSLRRETAGSVVLTACFDSLTGLEAHYATPGNGGKTAAVYYTVSVTATKNGWLALLPDGRFVVASSAEAKDWYRGLLPALPTGFRYAGLAEWGGFLCFSWEEDSFFRVGRAGIFIRKKQPSSPDGVR